MTNINNPEDPTDEEILECCCGVYTITLNHSVYIGSCECSFIEEYLNIKNEVGTMPYHLLYLGGEFTPIVAMEHYDEKRLRKYMSCVKASYMEDDDYTIVY